MKTEKKMRVFDFSNGKSVVYCTLQVKLILNRPFFDDPKHSKKISDYFRKIVLSEEFIESPEDLDVLVSYYDYRHENSDPNQVTESGTYSDDQNDLYECIENLDKFGYFYNPDNIFKGT